MKREDLMIGDTICQPGFAEPDDYCRITRSK